MPVSGIFHVLINETAHRGLYKNRERVYTGVDSGKKIPRRTGKSDRRQYCAWLFGLMLYQLSYPVGFGYLFT